MAAPAAKNVYEPWRACTLCRNNTESACCFRDGGDKGINHLFDALCCNLSSNEDSPFNQLGCMKCVCTESQCTTGDDGVDSSTQAFDVHVKMPEGENLCALAYCCCCSVNLLCSFPDACLGGACEQEMCCFICLQSTSECDCTLFPCYACSRISGSCAACDFQRPEGEYDALCSQQSTSECCCLCESQSKNQVKFQFFWEPELHCCQQREHCLCLVSTCAFPTTTEVPCGLALLGFYCYGEDAIVASGGNATNSMNPKSST